MDRVTSESGNLGYVKSLLPGLTLEELQLLKAELIPRRQSELLGMARRGEDRAAERHRERAARMAAEVQLDVARRNAIWFPRRDELLPAGDMIPPQQVPVVPADLKE